MQLVQHKAQRFLRLLDLFTAHGARHIKHQDHIFGNHPLCVHLDLGCSQQQEKAIAPPVWFVAQQVDAHILGRDGIVEHKIAIRLDVVLFVADDGIVVPAPHNVHLVAGAIDRLQGLLAADRHVDHYLFQGPGRELFGVQGIDVFYQAVVHLQHLAVFQLDAPLAARGNGIDAGLEGIAAHVLQQRWIAPPPDDVLVDTACLVALQHLALQLFAVHPHSELADGRLLRQGEDIGTLHLKSPFVDKHLVDVCRRHLVFDGHRHPMIFDRQVGHLHDGHVGGRHRDNDAVGQDRHRRAH